MTEHVKLIEMNEIKRCVTCGTAVGIDIDCMSHAKKYCIRHMRGGEPLLEDLEGCQICRAPHGRVD